MNRTVSTYFARANKPDSTKSRRCDSAVKTASSAPGCTCPPAEIPTRKKQKNTVSTSETRVERPISLFTCENLPPERIQPPKTKKQHRDAEHQGASIELHYEEFQ